MLTISDILNTLTVSSAVTFDSALVTVYVASHALTLRVSTFPNTVSFCVLYDSNNRQIISLYVINWLTFVMETVSLRWEVNF